MNVAPRLPLETVDSRACRKCGEYFQPRKGGKPQSFCSPECRTAFHATPEHDAEQRSPTCTLPMLVPQAEQPEDTADALAPFHWDDVAGDIVQRECKTVAIFENPNGDIVVRAQAQWPNDDADTYIVIARANIDRVIKKLEALR